MSGSLQQPLPPIFFVSVAMIELKILCFRMCGKERTYGRKFCKCGKERS